MGTSPKWPDTFMFINTILSPKAIGFPFFMIVIFVLMTCIEHVAYYKDTLKLDPPKAH